MRESLQQRVEKIRLWAKDPDHAASHILITILVVIILVTIAIAIVWIVPKHEAATLADTEKRLALENEFRKTLTQIVLSIFGLFILYFTWQRARAGDKTVQIMEQGHITDRYTKAIEQLGKLDGDKPNIEVRLGAIYALERIARDSPRDHWTIMEVLTAYVRQNAPAVKPGETPDTPPPRKPRTDIQAILTVLGRRPLPQKRERPDQQLDLSSTHLQNADLHRANLNGASFMYANLTSANLWDAKLHNANFLFSNLDYANLWTADLQGATINSSSFHQTSLAGANLKNASLGNARGLEPAQVKAANFWEEAYYSPEFRATLGLPPEAPASTPPAAPTP